MSADALNPGDFLNFALAREPRAAAEDFLPRSLYGEYLQTRLRDAERNATDGTWLESVSGTATSLTCLHGGPRYGVQLADGRTLLADEVVLALGNPPSPALPGSQDLRGGAQYIADPWSAPVHFRAGERVLVVGTGLTMADVVIAGLSSARSDVHVHAISRHGLVPPSQAALRHGHVQIETRRLIQAASFSTRALFRAVRELVRDTARAGADWRDVINHLRNLAPQLWQRMPLRERQRFLRHLRPYWDIHRHRLPRQTRGEIDNLRQQRRLSVHAGRILALQVTGDKVRVTWRPRGTRAHASLLVDRVINCTGPNYDPRRSPDPLLISLLSQGLVVPDALGLGLRTSAYGALLDAKGRCVPGLYYIGPMLRPDHWETTAVQELRDHAARLAHHLSSPVLRRSIAL
jgi:uncharacterized NAD(P)/FAD-binding protein YdhS